MVSIFLIIKKIFNYLNSNESIENLSLSITISVIFCLVPKNLIFHPLLILILIILNGNLLIFLFATPFFNIIVPFMYKITHIIGDNLLSNKSMEIIYIQLSNIPLLSFFNWNNTVSLGGYIVSIIFAIPIFHLFKKLIRIYRRTILEKIKQNKLFKLYKLLNWVPVKK